MFKRRLPVWPLRNHESFKFGKCQVNPVETAERFSTVWSGQDFIHKNLRIKILQSERSRSARVRKNDLHSTNKGFKSSHALDLVSK